MHTTLKRLAYAGMFLLPFAAAPLQAQVKTAASAEGTSIVNTAKATYTDANSNTYAEVTGQVTIIVGFFAAPDPSVAATSTPASGSSGNVATFTIKNSGNGTDQDTISMTVASGLTVTGYTYNGTTYTGATALADLNAVLKTVSLVSGASYLVDVIYNVASATGGSTLNLTLNQTSWRSAAPGYPGGPVTYSATHQVKPPTAFNVSVTPDAGTVSRVASGTAPAPLVTYTETFGVTNTGNANDTYAISASVTTTNNTVTITNVSVSSLPLNSGSSGSVVVTYTVSSTGTGPDKIVLTATGNSSDQGDVTVSVSRAAVTVAKTAHKTQAGAALTATAADAVVPGIGFWYKLSVTNAAGSAVAKSVVVTDELPATLSYVSHSPDTGSDWTMAWDATARKLTATLTSDLAANATRFVWLKVQIPTTPATVVAP